MVSEADSRESSDELLWESYNRLLLSKDISRIRKLLARYRLFEESLDVPGDIVEAGVFRGAGLMYWAKLLEIFCPANKKRVIGFDVFSSFRDVQLAPHEVTVAREHDAISSNGVAMAEVQQLVDQAGFSSRVELVGGEVERTVGEYARENQGFRISLLHLDLDTYSGTKVVLETFWPLVSRGGVVVFDEYGIRGMGESDAVDAFFADHRLRLRSVTHADTPTAWLVKP